MVARVWFSRSILTPSLASTAWCRPSRPAAAGHQAAGELVDDDDFAVLDHVVQVALEEHVGLQGLLHVVVDLDVVRVVEIAACRAAFRTLSDAFFGEGDAAMLFVDGVIAGGVLLARLFAFDHLAADQAAG